MKIGKLSLLALIITFTLMGCSEELTEPPQEEATETDVSTNHFEKDTRNPVKEEEKAETKTKELENTDSQEETKEDSNIQQSTNEKVASETTPQEEPKNYIEATVNRVVDGDTMEVTLENGKTEKLRLLLVDTPETVHPSKPVMPFGPEASKYAKETLTNQKVQLHIDVSERDKYGRLLVYLHVNGTDFNKSLIEKGLARVAYVWAPNTSRADEYYAAQKEAQQKAVGIWSIENYATTDGEGDFNYQEEASTSNTELQESSSSTFSYTGPYDPFGADRDCGDFTTQADAQAFYEAAGGPGKDPHRLDGNDNDGLVCESL